MADTQKIGEIKIDTAQAQKAIETLIKELKDLNIQFKQTEKSAPNFKKAEAGMVSMGASITKVAGIVGVATGVYEIFMGTLEKGLEFAKKGLELAKEEESANRRLLFSLNGNKGAYQSLIAWKEKMRKTTIFTREEIDGVVNMGISLGRTTIETEKMTKVAMGLSKVTGQDLNTIMMTLNGTYEGVLGRLTRLDGSLKSLTKEELANGAAVDKLGEKYNKFATTGLSSAAGQIKMLNKEIAELQLELGNKLLPTLRDVLKAFNQLFMSKEDRGWAIQKDMIEENKKVIKEYYAKGDQYSIQFAKSLEKVNMGLQSSLDLHKKRKEIKDTEEENKLMKESGVLSVDIIDKRLEDIKAQKQQIELGRQKKIINEEAYKAAMKELNAQEKVYRDYGKGPAEPLPPKEKKEKTDTELADNKAINDAKLKQDEDYFNNQIKLAEDAATKINDPEKIKAAYDSIKELINKSLEEQTKQVGITYDTELEDLKKQQEKGLITKEEFDRKKILLDLNYENKRNELNYAYGDKILSNEEKKNIQLLKIREKLLEETKKILDQELVAEADVYKSIEDRARNSSAAKIKIMLDEAAKKHELFIQGLNDEASKAVAAEIDPEQKIKIQERFNETILKSDTYFKNFSNTMIKGMDDAKKKSEELTVALSTSFLGPFEQIGNDFAKLVTDIRDKTGNAGDSIKKLAVSIAKTLSTEVFGALQKNIQDTLEKGLASVDEQYNKETEKLDAQLKKRTISQAKYDKQKEKLDKEKIAKEKELKTKAAKQQRDADVIQAIVSTALGVIMATQSPPPLDIIMPILIGALGAAQIALILSQPLPTFAKGGLVPRKYAVGGIINGPSHSQGGVPINAEGGEYIINKNVVKQPNMTNVLDSINKGQGYTQSQNQPATATISAEELSKIRSIPVVVSEYDITRIQKRVAVIENKSTW